MEVEKSYFDKLHKVKVKTEKKKCGNVELDYASWSDVWVNIKKNHPTANYTIYENELHQAYFESEFGIDVKVGVTIEGVEHVMRLPVLDGSNKSMKRIERQYDVNEYVNGRRTGKKIKKTVEAATQFDINKTIMRCFVKACAMHGLGLYVYMGQTREEENNNIQQDQEYIIKCEKCGKNMISKTGIKNGKKWSGLFCSSGDRSHTIFN